MTTTIRINRQTRFQKSDALRDDETLYAEAQVMGAWLAQRPLSTVTANQVLVFVQQTHPAATLQRAPVEYLYVWDEQMQMYRIMCFDVAVISYLPDGESVPIEIEVEISATY